MQRKITLKTQVITIDFDDGSNARYDLPYRFKINCLKKPYND